MGSELNGQAAKDNKELVLEVNNLVVHYVLQEETVEAVNGISFSLEKGKTIGLVGETGAGKTTTALAIMNLVPDPPGVIKDGQSRCAATTCSSFQRGSSKIRGKEVSMIFQDPMTSLNPVIVGDQIAESIMLHESLRIPRPSIAPRRCWRWWAYPAPGPRIPPVSGGMRQRVGIAIALACNPKLLLADEPTTALDVTIQAQVLDMIDELKRELGTALVMITHDLGVVAKICDLVAVMYAGRIVEYGTLEDVFDRTLHPYTEGLFNSLPDIRNRKNQLQPIPGLMPDPTNLPRGCSFAPRCRYVSDACREAQPTKHQVSETHVIYCSAYDDSNFQIERARGRGGNG